MHLCRFFTCSKSKDEESTKPDGPSNGNAQAASVRSKKRCPITKLSNKAFRVVSRLRLPSQVADPALPGEAEDTDSDDRQEERMELEVNPVGVPASGGMFLCYPYRGDGTVPPVAYTDSARRHLSDKEANFLAFPLLFPTELPDIECKGNHSLHY